MNHEALAPADYAVLSALYDELSELEGPARAARLAALHEAGHPLAGRLVRMLAAMNGPRTDEILPRAPRPQFGRSGGDRIGPWRLLSPLGSGGMAEVWLAVRDDGGLKREVALKLPFIAPGASGSTRAQRFARERDILAALRHPHIAALLDAGVEPDGQTWLALERVQGERITTWCDTHRAPLRQRVELFRQVLLAVQHAHAQLVIHRDIKPANVLVTTEGEVRLLDFGIAKLLGDEGQAVDDTELTQQAGRPLTPRYASPEQLRGEALSTASDVYSLGVLLHELLTGRLPYTPAHGGAAELERAIVDSDVPLPSRTPPGAEAAAARASTPRALQKLLAPELDAVLLRALARQPAERYRSVDALLDDIERWQRGVPVRARTPSAWFRARRFVGRHPLGVGLGVSVAVGLMGLSVTAMWYGFEAREQSQRATLSREFLLRILGKAESDQHRGADISAREMLDWGRQRANAMTAATPGQRADLLRDIARVQVNLTDYAAAALTLDELAPLLQQIGRKADAARVQIERVEMALRLGDLPAAAERLARARAAMLDHPSDDLQALLAEVEGWFARMTGDAQAATRFDAMAARAADRAWPVQHERRVLIKLQQAHSTATGGQPERGLALLDALLAELATVSSGDTRQTAGIEYARAGIEVRLGRFGSVVSRLGPTLQRCETEVGKSWEVCANLRRLLALALLRTGDMTRAEFLLGAMLGDLSKTTDPLRRNEALLYAARVLATLGRVDFAATPWPEVMALARGEQVAAQPAYMRVQAQQMLAEALLRSGQPGRARPWIEASRQLMASSDAPMPMQSLRAEVLAGAVHWLSGHPARALQTWTAVHSEAERLLGATHPLTWLYALNLAHAQIATGQLAQANATLEHALPLLGAALGTDSPHFRRVAAWRRNPAAAGPATAQGLLL